MTKTKTELSIALNLNTNITQTQIEDFLLNNYVWSGTRFAHVDRETHVAFCRTILVRQISTHGRNPPTERWPWSQIRVCSGIFCSGSSRMTSSGVCYWTGSPGAFKMRTSA